MRAFALAMTAASLTLCTSVVACSSNLPSGYGEIAPADWGESEAWRSKNPTGFLQAEGDFNGDGIRDEAIIAFRRDTNTRELLIRNGGSNSDADWIVLQEVSIGEGVTSLGPQRHRLYCFGDLEPDQFCEIDLDYDSINLFIHDAAYQVYFWDLELQQYRSLWGSI